MDINNIILTSRIRLARNINNMPFPNKQNDLSANDVLDTVFHVAKDSLNFHTYKLSELTEEKIAYYMENNLISKDISMKYGGLAYSDDEVVSIMVNEEDHIRMQCILTGLNLKKAYDIINDIDSELMQNIDYAYDSELGFLTACPSNVGTGIRASVMMFLPALSITGNLEDISKSLKNMGITIRGSFGEGTATQGYLYQISNETTLGKSEKQIIQEVESAVLRLCDMETSVIDKIKESNDINLYDTILRAFGTLKYCYKLSSQEYYELSALTKLGCELGLIGNEYIEVIDELNYAVRPANLVELNGGYLNDIERDVFRAKYVTKRLNNIEEES